ncbi:MAG TPA: 2-oxo acid dehydrogenase subunit E2 [Gemmataceae bacterium]|nr:2-oxo acid dehydrogenase subunit E2 [Gemmataceae bacterium]
MASEIKLQALKEGVESVEVNAVKVAAGDVIAKDQALLEVQADKAALDVASPVAGRVAKVLVKPGDQVKVGQPYVVIEETDGAAAPAAKESPRPEKREQAVARTVEDEKEPAPKHTATVAQSARESKGGNGRRAPAPPPPSPEPADGSDLPLAGPATRHLARELGVDLRLVSGSGRNGRITPDDVKAFVRRMASVPAPTVAAPAGPTAAPKLPDFAKFGPVEPQPLTRVRKITAAQMALAWSLIPHVTQHDLADITDLEAFRKSQTTGPKLTVTAFALKACAIALKEFPNFNASLDLASGQLILKRYYHVGVAVDTDGGLLVPVIRDVDRKSVADLAKELTEAAELARKGKGDMQGGTFTITNLGGIGGTGFTPIVNWPEVAILGMSRSRLAPVVRDGQVVPRLMLPVSLSYDHRVIDGAAAARFTRRVAEMLENPLVMLLHA